MGNSQEEAIRRYITLKNQEIIEKNISVVKRVVTEVASSLSNLESQLESRGGRRKTNETTSMSRALARSQKRLGEVGVEIEELDVDAISLPNRSTVVRQGLAPDEVQQEKTVTLEEMRIRVNRLRNKYNKSKRKR